MTPFEIRHWWPTLKNSIVHHASYLLQQSQDETVDPQQAKVTDSQAESAWRERMATGEAKEIYRKRAATAECVNA